MLWSGISTSFAQTDEQQENKITPPISEKELSNLCINEEWLNNLVNELDQKGWIFHIQKGFLSATNINNNLQRAIPEESSEDEEWLKTTAIELSTREYTFYIQKFYVSATNVTDEDMMAYFARLVQSQYNFN